MKLCVDENILFAEKIFSPFGKVKLFNGRKINNKDILDCNILIVRSVTNVNRDLLKNTRVRFVGTATIGIDHIDTEYLAENDIKFAYAPGSNSFSVAEYLLAALLEISSGRNFSLKGKSIGIIGVGNIGSKVAKFAEALGMKVCLNDPPREDRGDKGFLALEEVLDCDFITFHVPLIKEGKYKTFHLLDVEKLKSVKKDAVIINTSRGEVIDNTALLEFVKRFENTVILDVWEGEPFPLKGLIKVTEISTPHIAGYSLDGKLNGAKMIFNSLNKYLGSNFIWKFDENKIIKNIDCLNLGNKEEILRKIVNEAYPIEKDSSLFKNKMLADNANPQEFDLMRKNYPLRYELPHYSALVNSNDYEKFLMQFRINIIRKI